MSRNGDSVYKRKDGYFEARYVKEIGLDGKKKYASVYGKTYREAKEKRQGIMDNILLYQTPSGPRNITVNQLAREWLYINQHRVKISSLQRYQGFWHNHIEKTIGDRTALSCTTIAISMMKWNASGSAIRISSAMFP